MPPDEFPDVVPYLYYADATRALAFLVDAFGLEKAYELRDDDDVVWSAHLRVGSGLIMIGPEMEEFGTRAVEDRAWANHRIHVLVDDLDAVVDRARAAGAPVLTEPVDHGEARIAILADTGHHQWIFAESLDQTTESAAGT